MKLLGGLSKLIITVLLVCMISITTTFIMVNFYTKQLFTNMGIPIDESRMTMSQFISQVTGKGKAQETGQETSQETSQESTPEDVLIHDSAVEVWHSQSTIMEDEAALAKEAEVIISLEDFNRTKDLLSDEDKMKVFSIVISNIPASEVQWLSSIMESGITQEELNKVEALMELYLDDKDYEEIMTIFLRYD